MKQFVKDEFAAVVALLALAALGVLIGYLMFHLGLSEPNWSRATYLLNGVEAVAFAAVGWLFGKDVRRDSLRAATFAADAAVRERGKGINAALALARDDVEQALKEGQVAQPTANRVLHEVGRIVRLGQELFG